MYFKDVAHSYGMSYERMEVIGDVSVWEFIMTIQKEKQNVL